jgi:hypothetical protein
VRSALARAGGGAVETGEGGSSTANDLRGRWEGVRRLGHWTKLWRRAEEKRRRSPGGGAEARTG